MNDIDSFTNIINLLSNLPATALLAVIAYAFYTGRVVPKQVIDEMIKAQDERWRLLMNQVVDEFRQVVSHAVEDGVVKAAVIKKDDKRL